MKLPNFIPLFPYCYFTEGASIPWSRDKKYTDMYTLLALHAMEGQLTEKCRTLTLERNMLVDSHQLC